MEMEESYESIPMRLNLAPNFDYEVPSKKTFEPIADELSFDNPFLQDEEEYFFEENEPEEDIEIISEDPGGVIRKKKGEKLLSESRQKESRRIAKINAEANRKINNLMNQITDHSSDEFVQEVTEKAFAIRADAENEIKRVKETVKREEESIRDLMQISPSPEVSQIGKIFTQIEFEKRTSPPSPKLKEHEIFIQPDKIINIIRILGTYSKVAGLIQRVSVLMKHSVINPRKFIRLDLEENHYLIVQNMDVKVRRAMPDNLKRLQISSSVEKTLFDIPPSRKISVWTSEDTIEILQYLKSDKFVSCYANEIYYDPFYGYSGTLSACLCYYAQIIPVDRCFGAYDDMSVYVRNIVDYARYGYMIYLVCQDKIYGITENYGNQIQNKVIHVVGEQELEIILTLYVEELCGMSDKLTNEISAFKESAKILQQMGLYDGQI